jgi:hypothetical protein
LSANSLPNTTHVGFESDQGILYGLASGGFPDKVVKAVLKEAKSGPIKTERLYEITRKRQSETEKKLS